MGANGAGNDGGAVDHGMPVDLTSEDFSDGGAISSDCTCEGDDVSPVLLWDEVPDGTVELVVTCEDPDAAEGTFVHWLVWGIEPDVREIGGGDVPPDARQGRNDFGVIGYRGPCPSPGHDLHHYHFVLYALGEPVDLPDGVSAAELRGEMEGKVLAEAELIGTFER